MVKIKKALFGYGGHALEVASFISQPVTFFVDDEYANDIALPISAINKDEYEIMIAIGDSYIRKEISQRLNGIKYFSFIHSTAIIGSNVEIGEGSYIGPYSIITTNVTLGKHTILNRTNGIGHDVIAKDYLSMMPGAIVGGSCNIGECVYIGSNSVVKEKISICDNVFFGLNSGVIRDISQSGVFVGTPARKIK
jgi:sugar O-acyltransferase (sialic acid O-acetyltransferase NeuD family)